MAEIKLSAMKRDITGKQVKALRREGNIPAIMYGSGISPIPIYLNAHASKKVISSASSSQLIQLEVEGENNTTLIRHKQVHPVTGTIMHVDFQRLIMTEKLRAMVRVEMLGEAPAVKMYDGILVTGQESVEVESLPEDLPEKIVIDLSSLEKIGDSIHVKDIIPPPNVVLFSNPDDMIVLITAPSAEEEIVEVVVAEGEPEVIERGKKEEEVE